MADENTFRMKLTIVQVKSLMRMVNSYTCKEIEDFQLVERINKHAGDFLILKGEMTRTDIKQEIHGDYSGFDFQSMQDAFANSPIEVLVEQGIDPVTGLRTDGDRN